MPQPRHWLMKSEPDVFGIEHLKAKGTAPWDGVRNFVARNYMIEMQPGDRVLFYHSSCNPPGVAGLAEVARTAYPDHTQFDPKSDYYDAKSTPEKPRWKMVDVRFGRVLPRLVSLDELKTIPELSKMPLFKYGRLSVQPVTPEEYAVIVKLAESPAPDDDEPKKPKPKKKPKR
jgi:predicted RNA-binding protein with PUA-like domain